MIDATNRDEETMTISESPSLESLNDLVTLFHEGRYPEAEQRAGEMAKCFPENGFIWKALGVVLKSQGRIAEALEPMEKAVALSPGDVEAHINLGNILKGLGRLEEARTSLSRAVRINPDHAQAHFNRGNILQDLGRLSEAEASYRRAVEIKPNYAEAWSNMGNTIKDSGRMNEAEASYRRALGISPDYAEAHVNLGNVLKDLDRLDEAEVSYRQAVGIRPDLAQGYNNLGITLRRLGRMDEAEESLRRALEIKPDLVESHNNLGRVLYESGQLGDAEASYRRALELDPRYFEALVNLGITLTDLGQLETALTSYRRAVAINPKSDFALELLGTVLGRVGKEEEAVTCLESAIALKPNGMGAYNTLGNILLHMGQVTKSLATFRRAQELQPVITSEAAKEKADFSVVFLDSPGPGSTPVGYLADKAPYDSHFYCVLPDVQPNIEFLRDKADVVVNLIADADNGKEILPFVHDIVERLGRPTVNPPRLIMNTDRETVARRLAGIALCHSPKTLRLAGPALAKAAQKEHLEGFTLPLLVRLAGNHGGDDFGKFYDFTAIVEFVSKHPEGNYYLTEYVDYRSADGFFRKYRLIIIEGELFPYHLAIHDDWKVHHFRTDMAHQPWMRQEEESFLRNPSLVFDQARQTALRAVARATGLDFSGIDCALDHNRDVIVFETNAAMRVHEENRGIFAYKNPYIARIKKAFDAKLARLAVS
jgi:tetratricopeptide (TPR) repeat protein